MKLGVRITAVAKGHRLLMDQNVLSLQRNSQKGQEQFRSFRGCGTSLSCSKLVAIPQAITPLVLFCFQKKQKESNTESRVVEKKQRRLELNSIFLGTASENVYNSVNIMYTSSLKEGFCRAF